MYEPLPTFVLRAPLLRERDWRKPRARCRRARSARWRSALASDRVAAATDSAALAARGSIDTDDARQFRRDALEACCAGVCVGAARSGRRASATGAPTATRPAPTWERLARRSGGPCSTTRRDARAHAAARRALARARGDDGALARFGGAVRRGALRGARRAARGDPRSRGRLDALAGRPSGGAWRGARARDRRPAPPARRRGPPADGRRAAARRPTAGRLDARAARAPRRGRARSDARARPRRPRARRACARCAAALAELPGAAGL